MELFAGIVIIIIIAVLIMMYGEIKYDEGMHKGFRDGQFNGSMNTLNLLHDIAVLDVYKLEQDLKDGKFNHHPGIKKGLDKLYK